MSRDITLADTFYALFTTRAFATGIPGTLGGSPVVSAYENENVTQITAGITLGVDHDGVTGLNLLTIVATGANGYEAGKDYALVITTGTVDSVSVVGEVVGEFTIGRSAAAVDLANGTDGLGALKTLIDALNDLSAAQVKTQVDGGWTTQMADSVPVDGTISTREQALYAILQFLTEFAISGTTLTVKKVDGSTSLMVFTLDDGTTPTSLTRAS